MGQRPRSPDPGAKRPPRTVTLLDVTVRSDTEPRKTNFGMPYAPNKTKRISMKKRSKVPMKKSKKLFSKTAKKVHNKNVSANPMRGGIRL